MALKIGQLSHILASIKNDFNALIFSNGVELQRTDGRLRTAVKLYGTTPPSPPPTHTLKSAGGKVTSLISVHFISNILRVIRSVLEPTVQINLTS